jgi:hypothetical protein
MDTSVKDRNPRVLLSQVQPDGMHGLQCLIAVTSH